MMRWKMPLRPAFLHCQLAYEPSKTGYLAGWIFSRSFAPPLRIRLYGTTLKSAPNPHQTPKSPNYKLIQRLGRPKPARGHLSPRIGDRWRLSRVDSHSHWMPMVLPPRAGPTHISWPNSPVHVVTVGGGGGYTWLLHNFAQNANRIRLANYSNC